MNIRLLLLIGCAALGCVEEEHCPNTPEFTYEHEDAYADTGTMQAALLDGDVSDDECAAICGEELDELEANIVACDLKEAAATDSAPVPRPGPYLRCTVREPYRCD